MFLVQESHDVEQTDIENNCVEYCTVWDSLNPRLNHIYIYIYAKHSSSDRS